MPPTTPFWLYLNFEGHPKPPIADPTLNACDAGSVLGTNVVLLLPKPYPTSAPTKSPDQLYPAIGPVCACTEVAANTDADSAAAAKIVFFIFTYPQGRYLGPI